MENLYLCYVLVDQKKKNNHKPLSSAVKKYNQEIVEFKVGSVASLSNASPGKKISISSEKVIGSPPGNLFGTEGFIRKVNEKDNSSRLVQDGINSMRRGRVF